MTRVPWLDPLEFEQARLFFQAMGRARPHVFDGVREAAGQIMALFDDLDGELTELCRLTCPGCQDNCCARATIWYDFKDLLFIYFSGQPLPDRQIEKKKNRFNPVCSHLTAGGCDLPRRARPFVCTWYLCPDQKTYCGMTRVNDRARDNVSDMIGRIKILRDHMEELFVGHCL